MPELPDPITCHDTFTHTENMVVPAEINDKNTLFGGAMISHMDVAGAHTVARITGKRCMTVGISDAQFLQPVYLNDFYTVEAYATGIGKSAIEVFIRFYVYDDFLKERTLAASAFFTFVPVDPDGAAIVLPRLVPETPEEKMHCAGFPARKEQNKAARQALMDLSDQ